jgi:hypothetical protein
MKQKILLFACNHLFFEYTKAAFASFFQYHSISEWKVIFADVGLKSAQRIEFSQFGEIVDYPPSTVSNFGVIWPSARARLKMLGDFIFDDSILLYLDSDILVFDNIDKLLMDFKTSGHPIGIFVEDIDEWVRLPASLLWKDHEIPEEFRNQEKWRNAPFANAGVMLAQGHFAKQFGEIALGLYEKYEERAAFAEQTIIVSLLYDRQIPYMNLAPRYNCMAFEKYITHVGSSHRYVHVPPIFRGEKIAIRHFAGHDHDQQSCKRLLDEALALIDVNAQLENIKSSVPSH